jgi:predicted nucleic acid-binding protein
MNAVDTNLLVYAVDTNEPVKQATARALLRQLGNARNVVLLWQVAGEFLSCMVQWERSNRITAADTHAYFSWVRRLIPLQASSEAIFDLSMSLRSKHSLSHWDSMLLAACIDGGIDTLYTEDLSHGVVYDGVTVLNPFVP